MAPAHAIDGPDAHDHATKQLAPELTIDGPQQDGYSHHRYECVLDCHGAVQRNLLHTLCGSAFQQHVRNEVVVPM